MTARRAGIAAALRGDPDADRLVPRGREAAWSIGFLAATMGFFAVLALALALAATRLAASWGGELAATATLTVIAEEGDIEAQARTALQVLRSTPGVQAVRVVEIAEQRALLAPWLGTEVPVESLPMPLIIEVTAERRGLDAERLRRRLAAEAPAAVFDDHTAWRLPLIAAAERLRLFALACIGLIVVAFAVVLRLAAGAAVAANGPAIRTLRLVGARDGYIAAAFVRRFTVAAVLGASLGTVAAMLMLAQLPPTREEGFFLVGIGLAGWHWLMPPLVPVFAGALAAGATRRAARRRLRRFG